MLYRFKEVRDIQEYTVAEIIAKIDEASTVNNTYITLKDYYKGNSAILSRASADAAKPNNKIVNNFAKYITDVNVGYFIGRPVTYTATGEGAELKEILQDIFDYNDEQDENAQLAKVASIKGVAYELLYVDEEANPRFNYVEP
ncbi:MAG TPA: phage portal protein, partial [bacterium]|nr:phage portal protein [bacterium]